MVLLMEMGVEEHQAEQMNTDQAVEEEDTGQQVEQVRDQVEREELEVLQQVRQI